MRIKFIYNHHSIEHASLTKMISSQTGIHGSLPRRKTVMIIIL